MKIKVKYLKPGMLIKFPVLMEFELLEVKPESGMKKLVFQSLYTSMYLNQDSEVEVQSIND